MAIAGLTVKVNSPEALPPSNEVTEILAVPADIVFT